MRKKYLDNTKWIIIILVVLYHIEAMYSELAFPNSVGPITSIHQFLDLYVYLINPWFMFLMFIISGMSTKYYFESHSNKEFIKSRTVKLLVPSIIGVLLFGWIHGYYTLIFGGVYESYVISPVISKFTLWAILTVSGIGQLWFLQVLWLFSMVILLLKLIGLDKLNKYTKKANTIVILALVLLVWGLGQVLNMPILDAYRIGFYFSGYLIGYLFLANDEVVDRIKNRWYVFLVAAVPFAVWHVVAHWRVPKTFDMFLSFGYSALAYFMSLFVLIIMAKWGNFENKFSKFMVKKSWGIYLFHYVLIKAIAWYLSQYAPNLPAILTYLIVIIGSFGGSIIMYEIISRIPFLRWCLCGVSKKRNKNYKSN